MAVRIQVRRDTAAVWTAANPVLAAGEPAYETDTGTEKIGDGSTAWAGLPEKPGRRWAATPTASAASDTGEILSILNAAAAAGGDQINLRRAPIAQPYLWNAAVTIPHLCNIVGPGKDATLIKLTAADARLKFADGGGGVSGGFSVHGGTDAARVATVGVEVAILNQRLIVDLPVQFTTQDAVLLNGTQNTHLQNVTAYHNDGNGITFDNGASSNHLDNCGGSNNLGHCLRFRQTIMGGVAPAPSFNIVTGGVFERPFKTGSTAAGLVHASAGYNNQLLGVTLSHDASDGLSVATALSAIKLTNDAIMLVTDPTFIGDVTYSTFADVLDTANLYLTGRIAPTGALVGLKSGLNTLVFLNGTYDPIVVGTPLSIVGYIQCATYPIPAAKAMPGFLFIDDADGKLKFREGTVAVPGTVQPLY